MPHYAHIHRAVMRPQPGIGVGAVVALAFAVVFGAGFSLGQRQDDARAAVQSPLPPTPSPPVRQHGPWGSLRTTGTQEVALTFDDGPDPRFTPQVLALLRQYRVKATFCVIGKNVMEFPQLVRQIVAEGHTLCNHSWANDVALGSRAKSVILSDMMRTNYAIRAAAPRARVSYFRQPGGVWTPPVVAAARELDMTSLHWTVDSKDALGADSRAIEMNVTSGSYPGAIVLLHDGGADRTTTLEALQAILPSLASRFSLAAMPTGRDRPRRHDMDLPV
jgi:peptidoglycan/xylan/chitin deacetylase (PgdA/CDA1 family)